MSHQGGYAAFVETAKAQLETAEGALSRDIAVGVANSSWASIFRDKFDVQALLEHIGEASRSRDWVAKLHASADKGRQQQPQRGRPTKPKTLTSKTSVRENADGNVGTAAPSTNA